MSDLLKPIPNPPSPWGDWRRPSLAVIACNGEGHGCVLSTVGPHVAFEINETGLRHLDDLGLDDAPAGISIWEGKTAGGEYNSYQGDYNDTYLVGKFREPTDEEWVAIRRGECPWDSAPWFPHGKGDDVDPDAPCSGPGKAP